jgi:hypothetical protein
MTRLKIRNYVIEALAIAGLVVAGALLNSREAQLHAAGGPTVTVEPSQLPLPVREAGRTGVLFDGSVTATSTIDTNNPYRR